MDLTGLLSNIYQATFAIDFGRKGFATRGKEQEGRISYELGVAKALSAFRDASNLRFASTVDPQAIILTEYTFLAQELQFCEKTDTDSLSSLTQAIQRFDEAFLTLTIVEDSTLYKAAEKIFSHKKGFRVKSYPNDSFHVATAGHRTRIKNILRAPGIDPIEKALLKQRFANLATAQKGYMEKQKKALA